MKIRFAALILVIGVAAAVWITKAEHRPRTLAEVRPIDAHVHILREDASFTAMLLRFNLDLININYIDKHSAGFENMEPQQTIAIRIFHDSKGRIAWCSTFDPAGWQDSGFQERSVGELEAAFREGAVGVKIHKSVGMELKAADGRYVMPDDAIFDPILRAVAARGKALFLHSAEPFAAWEPLDPSSPHYAYYQKHPEWHFYRHPEKPSKQMILQARDRLLKKHPELRIIGCHLGSMEEDIENVALHLQRYPNFVVDTAARVPDLMLLPQKKVRNFLLRYQDRVIYGSDLSFLPGNDVRQILQNWERTYERDWKFFATTQEFEFGKKRIRGLGLPGGVLRKIYRENALKWILAPNSTKLHKSTE